LGTPPATGDEDSCQLPHSARLAPPDGYFATISSRLRIIRYAKT